MFQNKIQQIILNWICFLFPSKNQLFTLIHIRSVVTGSIHTKIMANARIGINMSRRHTATLTIYISVLIQSRLLISKTKKKKLTKLSNVNTKLYLLYLC